MTLLKRYDSLPEPLPEVFARLHSIMKSVGTDNLLKSRIENKEKVHWHEFLGNYAGKNRDDDAVFNTAVALNALLDTWTNRKGKVVEYDAETPIIVKEVIKKGVNYLLDKLK